MIYLRKNIEKLAESKGIKLTSSQLSKMAFWEKQFNRGKLSEEDVKKMTVNLFRSQGVYLKSWEMNKLFR